MQEPTRIMAIRHGETSWNVDGRIQGHTDIPLNDQGRRQARQLARALAGETPAALYSSDLKRAMETAREVAHHCHVTTVPEPRLRERCFGHYEGRTFAQVALESPEQALRWRQRDPEFTPRGGESLVMLRERVEAVVDELAARHAGALMVLVAHGGVMDVLYRLATRQHLQAARSWQLPNAAINRLLWSPEIGLTLVGWADTRHLDLDTRDELHG